MKLGYINQLFDNNEFEDIFKEFDFSLLEDNEFKEDAVREEIVFPLLKALGYSASSDNKIIRSKPLKHPFYYFGTKKFNVNIIPDYAFQIDGEIKWILDAKRPTEKIEEGKNVYQAYSYAMHQEVQSEIFCLCNGKKITVFNVKKHSPILSFEIKNLEQNWNALKDILTPEIVCKPYLSEYKLDFGLFLLKVMDLENILSPIDYPLERIDDITKISEDLYSINAEFSLSQIENKIFMGSFDFNRKQYEELLSIMNLEHAIKIQNSLNQQPFTYKNDKAPLQEIIISAKIGQKIISNNDESYLPFDVIKFKTKSSLPDRTITIRKTD